MPITLDSLVEKATTQPAVCERVKARLKKLKAGQFITNDELMDDIQCSIDRLNHFASRQLAEWRHVIWERKDNDERVKTRYWSTPDNIAKLKGQISEED